MPSEEDKYYRYQTIQGHVHDMGAAMQGGVGGHAGLFSNANDVAKIMQMYLQGGEYGGTQFLDSRTIKKFNTCYFVIRMLDEGWALTNPNSRTRDQHVGVFHVKALVIVVLRVRILGQTQKKRLFMCFCPIEPIPPHQIHF